MRDVFFDPENMMGLARTLKRICGEGTEVWAASELRAWTGECLNQLAQGFQVVEFKREWKIQVRLPSFRSYHRLQRISHQVLNNNP